MALAGRPSRKLQKGRMGVATVVEDGVEEAKAATVAMDDARVSSSVFG